MADKREFRPPPGKAGLTKWLEERLEKGKSVIPEFQMKLNLAFVLGHQWLVWDRNQRQFRRPRSRPDDPNAAVRITANKVGGVVERTVSKLTKNAPIPEVRPASDDENDLSAARVGTRILTHEMERLHWRKWLADFLFWPTTLGWSYAHVRWDPQAGEKIGNRRDPDGNVTDDPLHMGEVCLEKVPAFELVVDPNAMSMDEAKWCVWTRRMSAEAIFERYGVEIHDQGDFDSGRTLVQEVQSLADASYDEAKQEFIAVNQFWMVPCRAAPEGMVVTWTGREILEERRPFPYEHGKLPFIQCDLLPGLGTREGRTWVNDLIPLQVDYNDARSREATFRRQLAPKIIFPAGSIDPNRLTSRVEAIPYNPTGQPPQAWDPPSNWMQMQEVVMQRASEEIGERAGSSEVSQGHAPSTMPAAAILALQEADDTKLAVSATNLADFTSRVGYQVLLLCRQFWREERTVRVYSEDATLDVRRYRGSDIQNRLDVHVTPESALPRSKSARVQLLMELQARGMFQGKPQEFVRALDLPGMDAIVRDMDLDEKRQAREISHMLEGQDAEVYPWDNHAVHLYKLNEFRKTVDYEMLDDETKGRIDAHASVHEGMLNPQMGVPTPGTNDDPAMQQGGAVGEGGPTAAGPYMDPLTGMPPNPTAVAAGQTPSPVTDDGIYKQAGIGQAAGQPGRVPGIPADNQASSMGE